VDKERRRVRQREEIKIGLPSIYIAELLVPENAKEILRILFQKGTID